MRNRRTIMTHVVLVGILFVIFAVCMTKTKKVPDKKIKAVNFIQTGGIAGVNVSDTVFKDGEAYYYTDKENVYTIPKKEFEKLISKLTKLHLEEIDGYHGYMACCDAFGYEFNIWYEDGTIISGTTYFAPFPEEHNAKLLQSYFDEIKTKEECDYKFEVNDTYDSFRIVNRTGKYPETITTYYDSKGNYGAAISSHAIYKDEIGRTIDVDGMFDITKDGYKESRDMACAVFQALDGEKSDKITIEMESPFFGKLTKGAGDNKEKVLLLYDEIIKLLRKGIRSDDQD